MDRVSGNQPIGRRGSKGTWTHRLRTKTSVVGRVRMAVMAAMKRKLAQPWRRMDVRAMATSATPLRGVDGKEETMTNDTELAKVDEAKRAGGAATCRVGNTSILAVATCERWRPPRPATSSNFVGRGGKLLEVEYRERAAARGRIPPTASRNEAHVASAKEKHVARSVAKAVRACLEDDRKSRRAETHVTATRTSVGKDGLEADAVTMAIRAASTAVRLVRDAPTCRPVTGVSQEVNVREKGVPSPSNTNETETESHRAYVRVAADPERVYWMELVVNGRNHTCKEEEVLKAVEIAMQKTRPLLDKQQQIVENTSTVQRDMEDVDRIEKGRTEPTDQSWKRPSPFQGDNGPIPHQASHDRIRQLAHRRMADILIRGTAGRDPDRIKAALEELKDEVRERLRLEGLARVPHMAHAVHGRLLDMLEREVAMEKLRSTGTRQDGRTVDDLRKVMAKVNTLPVVHGSSQYQQGDTSVWTTTTLGALDDAQRVDGEDGPTEKRFMVHCTYPLYSVGETGLKSATQDVEAAHEYMVESALLPLMPSDRDFPYTVKLNADVLADDGGSAASAVCGASLALVEAGVPISHHCAGVTIGMHAFPERTWHISSEEGEEEEKREEFKQTDGGMAFLTDPAGVESSLGELELQVAGTTEGITALQLEMNGRGIRLDELGLALEKAKVARMQLLHRMEQVIPAGVERPRKENAPHCEVVSINPDSIGKLIGPGGSAIRALESETGAKLSINDNGDVLVFGPSKGAFEKAKLSILRNCKSRVEVGKVYNAKVVKIMDYGAFVELEGTGGSQGLVHISELAHEHVRAVRDVLGDGESLTVECVGVDPKTGNVKLSRKTLIPKLGSSSGESESLSRGPRKGGQAKARTFHNKR